MLIIIKSSYILLLSLKYPQTAVAGKPSIYVAKRIRGINLDEDITLRYLSRRYPMELGCLLALVFTYLDLGIVTWILLCFGRLANPGIIWYSTLRIYRYK